MSETSEYVYATAPRQDKGGRQPKRPGHRSRQNFATEAGGIRDRLPGIASTTNWSILTWMLANDPEYGFSLDFHSSAPWIQNLCQEIWRDHSGRRWSLSRHIFQEKKQGGSVKGSSNPYLHTTFP